MKGDPVKCGSFRGIKLLEHAVKVVERILEYKIRQWIDIHDMQFGFMEGKGTTDAILLGHFLRDDLQTHTHTQPFYCSSGICPGPPG